VRRRLEAAWRWEQEDWTGLAAGLGGAALWDDWRSWPAEHQAALAVDAEAICRVMASYLTDAHLTAGWSCPRPEAEVGAAEDPAGPEAAAPGDPPSSAGPLAVVEARTAAIPGRADTAEEPPPGPASAPARLADYRPRRVVLDNGLRLVFERRPATEVVALELFVDAGSVREARPGLAALTGRLLEEGAAGRDAAELAAAIEDVGGSLEVGATGASIRFGAEELDLGLELLADVARRPAFPAEAIERIARRIAAELRGDLDDPAFRAELSFRALVYGAHPLGRDPRGGARDLARLARQDVLDHHRHYFVPEGAILVVVGDFDPRRLVRLVTARFGDWPARGRPPGPVAPVSRPGRPRARRIHHPGDQVHIVLGHLGVARRHPDYDALVILDHIFGSGPGFCDRLGRIVRDELGLVYAIGGGMTDSADVLPGLFRVAAATMPEEVERVIATVTDQVRAMRRGAFSDEEVDRARRYLAGAWVFDFLTVEQRAERLLDLERWGLDLDEPLRWPDRILAITSDQVRKAARAHLRPEALCRVELGPLRRRGQRTRAECA
jgi:zinc protease